MSMCIPLEEIKAITGASTDEKAVLQWQAVVGMVEGYLGRTLCKRDFCREKITLPYGLSRVVQTSHSPINSVYALEILDRDGSYQVDDSALSYGGNLIQVLDGGWNKLSGRHAAGAVAAVQVSYNAGLYGCVEEMPPVLLQALYDLLDYKYNTEAHYGFASEHLGDYSYSRGSFVRGLPAEIAGVLDGLNL